MYKAILKKLLPVPGRRGMEECCLDLIFKICFTSGGGSGFFLTA